MATRKSSRPNSRSAAFQGDKSARILGIRVPALFPSSGPVTALIYGEAPGPRGADKSGFPFFGDRSGRILYRTLIEAGRCTLNASIDDVPWDGVALRDGGVRPTMIETALSNAYPSCPSDDGESFRAPSKKELGSDENVARVGVEIARARSRGLRTVVALGRHADWLLADRLGLREQPDLAYFQIPHPSPLGLMWLGRERGGRYKMPDLEQEWMRRFRAMVDA